MTSVLLLLCQSVTAQNQWKKTLDEFVFVNPPFAQCHASTLVELPGGRLLAAWFGGSREGNKDVQIWTASKLHGIWSPPRAVADGKSPEASYPCWNPVLFLNGETLYLYYKVGPNPREWWGMYKTSADFGQSWSAAVRLPHGLIGPVKNKPVRLADGTLLSASSTESLQEEWKAHIERSVDNGKTWSIIPVDHSSPFNVIQPSVLSYRDGRLQLLCRSKEGHVMESWSGDGGMSWSALQRTSLLNPNSGTDAVTLRDGTQLIVYNPLVPGKDWWNGRFKLAAALSTDGKTWTDIALLEDGTKEEFSYPAVIQTNDGKVHITYTFDRKNIKHVVLEADF